MNKLVTKAREIAQLATRFPFDAKAIAEQVTRDEVELAIEQCRHAITPAKSLPAQEREAGQVELAKAIRSIGLRVRPDFSKDQAQMWMTAIVEALSNKPLRVSIKAARDAIHIPIEFPGQVHKIILQCCEEHEAKLAIAKRNLDRLLWEIDNPQPKIEAKPFEPMTHEELQDMPDHLRQLGIAGGWLIEEGEGIRWATDAEQLDNERRIARARKSGARA